MVLAFCDIETTGLSREKHEIIEIAGIIWDSATNTVIEKFTQYIKPNSSIPAIITSLTGISNKTVERAPKVWDVLPNFFAFLKANRVERIIGHNFKAFDMKFIEAQIARYKLDEKYPLTIPEIIDTLAIARDLNKRGLISTANNKQETLAAYFGIQYDAHSAHADVEALLEIYKQMRRLDPKLI